MTTIKPFLVDIIKESGKLLSVDGTDIVRIEDYDFYDRRVTINHMRDKNMNYKPVSVSGFGGELPVEEES